jgi:uncharacterized protein (TIGR03083 family)
VNDNWIATRLALTEVSHRCAGLIRTVDDDAARAVGDWSVRDVAAHLLEVTTLNTAFATGDPPGAEWAEVYARALRASMDEVSELNALALSVVGERSAEVLAGQIDAQVEQLLDATAAADGSEQVEWLGGTKVPLRAILAHTLSELFVHGNDVARPGGGSFPLAAPEARLIFEVFLTDLVRSPDVTTFAARRSEEGKPVSVELRLGGGTRMTLVSTGEEIAVQQPGEGRPDVRVSADPGALWLVMSGRMNPVGAALRRRVVVWGRRPWRLRRLMAAVRTP